MERCPRLRIFKARLEEIGFHYAIVTDDRIVIDQIFNFNYGPISTAWDCLRHTRPLNLADLVRRYSSNSVENSACVRVNALSIQIN